MKPIQWDDVPYFITLARQGSLSATARLLGVEHSTVARRVDNLERSLKLKLFNRFARGWTLTPEGEKLLEQAHALEEEMMAFQRAAIEYSPFEGKVEISAPLTLVSLFLIPHLSNFRQMYPNIELILSGESHGANLSQGEADIALRILQTDDPSLVTRRLVNLNYALYESVSAPQLTESEQVFIGFRDSSLFPLKKWFESYIGSRRYALRCKDMLAMSQAAANALGIALLPKYVRQQNPRLKVYSGVTPPSLPLYLVMHTDVRRTPRIRASADFIIDLFEKNADEF